MEVVARVGTAGYPVALESRSNILIQRHRSSLPLDLSLGPNRNENLSTSEYLSGAVQISPSAPPLHGPFRTHGYRFPPTLTAQR